MRSKTILDEIRRRKYNCLICDDTLTFRDKVWSCSSCFCVYHLSCISKWAVKSKDLAWRCPHCRVDYSGKPKYRCWCQKELDPEKNPQRPHSCGQTCGFVSEKEGCKHPCTDFCHPGPHKECRVFGPIITCFCGKTKTQNLCSATNLEGYSCGNVCAMKMPCGQHKCRLICHSGELEPHLICSETLEVSCFCGRDHQVRQCSTVERLESGPGYACNAVCGAALECGVHRCERTCHPPEAHDCPFKVRPQEKCPCGKSTVESLLGKPRQGCSDSLPTCGKVCGRPRTCKHSCRELCHTGACPPCSEVVTVRCRCGASENPVPCGQQLDSRCQRTCHEPLSCGRHRCQKVCCPDRSTQATARNRKRGRNISIPLSDDGIASAVSQLSLQNSIASTGLSHRCPQTCGKTLTCKNHTCRDLCHSGPCNVCYQASFQGYSCPCGAINVPAPIRCGTVLPICTSRCHRRQPCGHTATHRCHSDEMDCEPCAQLLERQCVCGKMKMMIPCRVYNARTDELHCRNACGRMLACGHRCPSVCHDGDCPPCESQCMRPLECRSHHPHLVPCHGLSECGSCNTTEVAICACGNLRVSALCSEQVEVFCNQHCADTTNLYNREVRAGYQLNVGWCQKIENDLRKFVRNNKESSLWFKPMKREERRFVHNLVQCFGLIGESMDYGRNRSVRARKPTGYEPVLPMPVAKAIEIHRLFDLYGISEPEAALDREDSN